MFTSTTDRSWYSTHLRIPVVELEIWRWQNILKDDELVLRDSSSFRFLWVIRLLSNFFVYLGIFVLEKKRFLKGGLWSLRFIFKSWAGKFWLRDFSLCGGNFGVQGHGKWNMRIWVFMRDGYIFCFSGIGFRLKKIGFCFQPHEMFFFFVRKKKFHGLLVILIWGNAGDLELWNYSFDCEKNIIRESWRPWNMKR